ncbi:MAG: malto-oligosyltrehalose synthase [Actinomycetota bacterium]
MRVPTSTYRLQLGRGFSLDDARRLTPYLRALGVGDLYASPLLAARAGSTHGYDAVDPTRLNPDLGGEEAFDALAGELERRGMGLLLDIVPNHMAASDQNPWWWDVLRHGRRSGYAEFFDIDWAAGGGQVLAPVLDGPFGAALEAGRIRVEVERGEPVVRYSDLRFPVDPRSFQGSPEDLLHLNGTPGDPRSFDVLEALLNRQHYRLADWRIATREIDYRRFFDISDLVSLRMEDPAVFDAWHAMVLELVRRGQVTGLRVDHVDGLTDPAGYLRRLRTAVEDRTGDEGYVVAEKILGRDERLRDDWALAGTTGYEFADVAEGLLVDRAGAERIHRAHAALVTMGRGGPAPEPDFDRLAARCKRLVLERLFAGEGGTLASQLHALALEDRAGRDIAEEDLRAALVEVMAWLPVYRTYTTFSTPVVSPQDRRVIEDAVREAASSVRPSRRRAVAFVGRVLMLETAPGADWDEVRAWTRFVVRWQRLSGPAAAKGVEDTALYRWDGLLSRGEVGTDPGRPAIPVEEFHRRMRERRQRWPGSLNAGSTHDSKRSEDTRARLHVLSEVPDEWVRRVTRWRRINGRHRRLVPGRGEVPDVSFELHLYQSILGVWPLVASERADAIRRLQAYAVKAARETDARTSWLAPDAAYERALRGWLRAVLAPANGAFRRDLEMFVERVAMPGAVNSLAGAVLRATAPGVPDLYQGCELWNLSLVDPDNRRPVDFETRRRLLEELDQGLADRPALARELAASWSDGRVKMHVLRELLCLRRSQPRLFSAGSYVPLEVAGRRRANAVAFARRHGRSWAVVAVARLTAALAPARSFPVGERAWPATVLHLPGRAPDRWTDVFTGRQVEAAGGSIRLAEALAILPVAVLVPRAARARVSSAG